MPVNVYIDGVIVPQNATLQVAKGSLSILQQTGVSTCEMVLQSRDASYRPQIGKLLSVFEDITGVGATLVFAGRIISTSESTYTATGTNLRAHRISCADFVWTTGKRNAGERTFSQAKRNDIIRALNTDALNGEGFGVTYIAAGGGAELKEIKLAFSTVREAFDQLAKLTDSVWWIDYEREIRFAPKLPSSATFTIDNSYNSILHTAAGRGELTVEEALDETLNRIVVKFGKTELPQAIETFGGAHATQATNGTRRNWTLAAEVARVPVVEVSGLGAQTVGIDNVDTGKQWYWNEGSKQISQDDGGTVLTSGQTLTITYIGLTYSALYRGDLVHQAAFGVLDGVIEISASTSTGDAETVADSLITELAQSSFVLRFPTLSAGAAAPKVGDRIDINRTYFPVVANLIVQSVRLAEFGDKDIALWRVIEAKRGPKLKDGSALLASGSVSATAISASGSSGGGGGAASPSPFFTATYAATLVLDAANGPRQKLTLTGECDLNITGLADGDEFTLLVIQDGTGYHSINYGANFRIIFGLSIAGDPNSRTYLRFIHDGDKATLLTATQHA